MFEYNLYVLSYVIIISINFLGSRWRGNTEKKKGTIKIIQVSIISIIIVMFVMNDGGSLLNLKFVNKTN